MPSAKGVIIAQTKDEAVKAVRSMMEDMIFGNSRARIVIEEFLTGREVSVLSFTDGNVVVSMVSSMDHKRAHDNDEGLIPAEWEPWLPIPITRRKSPTNVWKKYSFLP